MGLFICIFIIFIYSDIFVVSIYLYFCTTEIKQCVQLLKILVNMHTVLRGFDFSHIHAYFAMS